MAGESAASAADDNNDLDWTRLKECDSFMCPMSLCVMTDPVSTSDGQCYERAEIEKWLEINNTSPATGLPLANKELVPNLALKKATISREYDVHSCIFQIHSRVFLLM